ncbi:hypothetical protein IWZ01DRAFT_485522 [Phyllosticta capitalensis]
MIGPLDFKRAAPFSSLRATSGYQVHSERTTHFTLDWVLLDVDDSRRVDATHLPTPRTDLWRPTRIWRCGNSPDPVAERAQVASQASEYIKTANEYPELSNAFKTDLNKRCQVFLRGSSLEKSPKDPALDPNQRAQVTEMMKELTPEVSEFYLTKAAAWAAYGYYRIKELAGKYARDMSSLVIDDNTKEKMVGKNDTSAWGRALPRNWKTSTLKRHLDGRWGDEEEEEKEAVDDDGEEEPGPSRSKRVKELAKDLEVVVQQRVLAPMHVRKRLPPCRHCLGLKRSPSTVAFSTIPTPVSPSQRLDNSAPLQSRRSSALTAAPKKTSHLPAAAEEPPRPAADPSNTTRETGILNPFKSFRPAAAGGPPRASSAYPRSHYQLSRQWQRLLRRVDLPGSVSFSRPQTPRTGLFTPASLEATVALDQMRQLRGSFLHDLTQKVTRAQDTTDDQVPAEQAEEATHDTPQSPAAGFSHSLLDFGYIVPGPSGPFPTPLVPTDSLLHGQVLWRYSVTGDEEIAYPNIRGEFVGTEGAEDPRFRHFLRHPGITGRPVPVVRCIEAGKRVPELDKLKRQPLVLHSDEIARADLDEGLMYWPLLCGTRALLGLLKARGALPGALETPKMYNQAVGSRMYGELLQKFQGLLSDVEPSEFFIDVCKAFKDDPEPAETEGVADRKSARTTPSGRGDQGGLIDDGRGGLDELAFIVQQVAMDRYAAGLVVQQRRVCVEDSNGLIKGGQVRHQPAKWTVEVAVEKVEEAVIAVIFTDPGARQMLGFASCFPPGPRDGSDSRRVRRPLHRPTRHAGGSAFKESPAACPRT